MREGWKTIPFEKSIQKVKYTTKIPSSEYLPKGLFPIVSQEEGLISGYWDNEADVFRHNKPVVIFGDHTRIIKYVDFDFVLGADGVKILLPVEGLSAKFLSYYLRWYRVPSLGYSRHFKLLKEASIPLPSIAEQEKIVAELDCLAGIIEKKKQQLEELDKLAQSIFYDLFGDPITNEKGWEVQSFGEVFRLKSGDGLKEKDYAGGVFPVYGGNGISGYHDTFNKSGKHIIIGRVGAYCGNVRFVQGNFWLTDNAFDAFFDADILDFKFSCYLLNTIDLHRYANHAAQPVISNTGLKAISIPLPPMFLQNEFAKKIEAIEGQKELVKRSIAETETLFNSRMDYWFN